MTETELKTVLGEILDKGMADLSTKVDASLEEKLDARFKKFLEDNKLESKGAPVPLAPGAKADGSKYAEYSKFIKSVFRKDAEFMAKAMSEGTDSAGGFLVPAEFHAEVMRLAADYGIVTKLATRFPMKGDTLDIPVEASSVSVTWPGEGNNGTASQPVLGNAQLNAKTLMGLTPMSNELLADAQVDVVNYLMKIFAEAFAGELDNQAFNGTGSPFVGILNDASGTTTVNMGSTKTAFTDVSLANLRDLIGSVPASALPSSAFFISPTVWATVQKIQEGSQTVAAFQAQQINVGVGPDQVGMLRPHGYLWGYPVYLSDKLPAVSATAVSTKFIAFGSMSRGFFWGDRQQMTLSISEHATIGSANMFQANQSAVRFTQRAALKIGLPTAFAVLKTAAS